MGEIGWPPAAVLGTTGRSQFVLLCEHASDFIPPDFGDLGMSAADRHSHAAWDIGALDVARRLSARLDAPLVAGAISRLIYDCNRPLEAPDCIPERSEFAPIPGNTGLTATEKRARFDQIHRPFHETVRRILDNQLQAGPVTVITVHSFTPVYRGTPRDLDIGFLCHSDCRLAQSATEIEAQRDIYRPRLNAPYDASDGVTHSLHLHAEARGLDSVMVEIRNDLIDTAPEAEKIADHLAETLILATESVSAARERRA